MVLSNVRVSAARRGPRGSAGHVRAPRRSPRSPCPRSPGRTQIQLRHVRHGSEEAAANHSFTFPSWKNSSQIRVPSLTDRSGLLDPSVRHLNHGSFGAVLNECSTCRQSGDSDSRLIRAVSCTGTCSRQWTAPEALAEFVGAEAAGVAPVRNAPPGSHRSFLSSRGSAPRTRCSPPLTTTTPFVKSSVSLPSGPGRSGSRAGSLPHRASRAGHRGSPRRGDTETKLVVIDHVTSPTHRVPDRGHRLPSSRRSGRRRRGARPGPDIGRPG